MKKIAKYEKGVLEHKGVLILQNFLDFRVHFDH